MGGAGVGGVLLTQVYIAEMQPLLLVSSAGKGKHHHAEVA